MPDSPTESNGTVASQTEGPYAPIEEILEDVRRGKMVVMCDDEGRENEGDLILPASFVTQETMAFMIRYTGGIVCLALTDERANQLQLPPMTARNTASRSTAFTVSIDPRNGGTGISAADRAEVVQAAIDPKTQPDDIARPGHIFPLRAADGGVLARDGHTEASVDLARLAGHYPAAILSEVMGDDGTMLRGEPLFAFCREHGLKIGHIQDLIRYRRRHEPLIERVAVASLPTDHGPFDIVGYKGLYEPTGSREHVALVKGFTPPATDAERDALAGQEVLVRIHSECLTGDSFHSARCDCGDQLQRSLDAVQEAERGVVVYLRQEGRGIGLIEKLKAYALQDRGADTVEANLALGHQADQRHYTVGAQILRDLGVSKIRLMTNNPEKQAQLQAAGIDVIDRVPIIIDEKPANAAYLATKRSQLGHLLDG